MPALTSDAVRVDPRGYAWVGCEIAGFGTDVVYFARTDDLDFKWLERYELPTL